MAHITTDMIWSAQQQAYAEVAEARRAGNTFTLIEVRDGRGIAFIDGARSFENARQICALDFAERGACGAHGSGH